MDDLLREFLTETAENLATLDVEIVRLEQNPNDPDLIGSIFRLVHTIKGTCGFLGLPRLEHLAHAGENVLGKFRDRELLVTPAAVDLILASIDRIKVILAYLEQHAAEPEGTDEDLIAMLNAMAEGGGVTEAVSVPAAVAEPIAPTPPSAPSQVSGAEPDEFGFVPVVAGDIAALEANMKAVSKPSAPAVIAKPVVKAADEHASKGGGASVADQSIRVSVDQLEVLMTTKIGQDSSLLTLLLESTQGALEGLTVLHPDTWQ